MRSGLIPVAEGARVRTLFQKLSGSITRDGLWLKSTEAEGGQLHLVASAIGETKLPSRGTVDSATTSRYDGCFLAPVRRNLSFNNCS